MSNGAEFFCSDVYFGRSRDSLSALQCRLVFNRRYEMFKLIRLAIYALVGYTVYQFVSDVIEADSAQSASRGRGGARGGRTGRASSPITGAKRGGGSGKAEVTEDNDGGATRHRV